METGGENSIENLCESDPLSDDECPEDLRVVHDDSITVPTGLSNNDLITTTQKKTTIHRNNRKRFSTKVNVMKAHPSSPSATSTTMTSTSSTSKTTFQSRRVSNPCDLSPSSTPSVNTNIITSTSNNVGTVSNSATPSFFIRDILNTCQKQQQQPKKQQDTNRENGFVYQHRKRSLESCVNPATLVSGHHHFSNLHLTNNNNNGSGGSSSSSSATSTPSPVVLPPPPTIHRPTAQHAAALTLRLTANNSPPPLLHGGHTFSDRGLNDSLDSDGPPCSDTASEHTEDEASSSRNRDHGDSSLGKMKGKVNSDHYQFFVKWII